MLRAARAGESEIELGGWSWRAAFGFVAHTPSGSEYSSALNMWGLRECGGGGSGETDVVVYIVTSLRRKKIVCLEKEGKDVFIPIAGAHVEAGIITASVVKNFVIERIDFAAPARGAPTTLQCGELRQPRSPSTRRRWR